MERESADGAGGGGGGGRGRGSMGSPSLINGAESGKGSGAGVASSKKEERQSDELLAPSSPRTLRALGLGHNVVVMQPPQRRGLFERVSLLLLFLLSITVFALTLGSLIVGGTRWNAPCGSPMIPVYLVVNGLVMLLQLILVMSEYFVNRKRSQLRAQGRDYRSRLARSLPAASGVTFVFWFIWFIAGNIIVYSFHTPSTGVDCDTVLFYFAFAFLTIIWVALALSCFWLCVSGVVKSRRRRREGTSERGGEDDTEFSRPSLNGPTITEA